MEYCLTTGELKLIPDRYIICRYADPARKQTDIWVVGDLDSSLRIILIIKIIE